MHSRFLLPLLLLPLGCGERAPTTVPVPTPQSLRTEAPKPSEPSEPSEPAEPRPAAETPATTATSKPEKRPEADLQALLNGTGASLRGPIAGLDTGKTDASITQGLGGLGTVARGAGVSTRGAGTLGASGVGMGGGSAGVGYGVGRGAVQVQGMSMRMSGASVERPAPPPKAGGTFVHAGTNPIVATQEDRFSTFGIDVDTGSWMYARRFLKMGRLPSESSVRLEEMVNALHYDYPGPTESAFAIHVAAAPSPFTRDMDVVRVALQGKRLTKATREPATITFLVDVSGSMNEPDKLPWVREGIRLAVDNLRPDDRVAIATYAGATRLALPATGAANKERIYQAIETLTPGGGTNMGSGMELAYREANKELGSGRTSRVIVLSDGDANIGHVSYDEILKSIRGYVSEGVTMSTMGFGGGNYNDNLMEQLADAGNGNYTYIDSEPTLKRFFVDEMTSTLQMIAQDAKIQVEWNPDVVRSYRLLGYENRDIADQDFRNDKKDAGDIGAGHAVTALYEIALVDPHAPPTSALGTVRVRHKIPRHEKAAEVSVSIAPESVLTSVDALDTDAKAALGMALGAEILRGSTYATGLTFEDAARLLRASASGPHAAERLEAAELFAKAPTRAVASR